MDNSVESKKRKMKQSELELKENLDVILESKVFIPSEIVRSIELDDYKDLIMFIKTQKYLVERILIFEEKYKKEETIQVDKEMINRIELFVVEKDNIVHDVYKNQNKYVRKKTKVDIQYLYEVAVGVHRDDRSVESIRNLYNSNTLLQNISKSTARRYLVNNLAFKNVSVDLKGVRYFSNDNQLKLVTFIWRLIKDIDLGKEIFFFDEVGINGKCNKKKVWVHLNEEKTVQKQKQYKKLNILMVVSFTEVIYYEVNNYYTDTEVIEGFLERFVKFIGEKRCRQSIYIQDNATYHVDEKVLNRFMRCFARFLFIPSQRPECNFIEYIFNVLKKSISKEKNIVM